MKTHRASAAAFLAAAVLISACGDNSPLENTPAAEQFSRVISATAGSNLGGLYGNFVTGVPQAKVADRQGRPLAGVAVSFEAVGGGRLTGASATTDSAGLASPTSWRLGTGGTQSVRATSSGAAPLLFTAAASAPPAGTFRIEVRYEPGTDPTPAQQAAFDAAATAWTRLIVRGGAPYPVNEDAGCGDIRGETVNGVVIHAKLDSIDGAGSVLGQAGPCILRDADLLPAQGIMAFDVADLAALERRGQLEEVILHEMAHVLGFGTLWNFGAGIRPDYLMATPVEDPTFTGSASRFALFGLAAPGFLGNGAVPVENTGSPGTRLSHWREATFGQELMTGWLGAAPNPLSALTVAQFRDLGYEVNDALSDTYSFAAAIQAQVAAPIQLIERGLTSPLMVINRAGRIVRTIKRPLL
jgi:hypothetical protein